MNGLPKALSTLIVGAVGALLGAGSEAVACSCAAPPDVETAWRRSAAVFEGEVTDIDTPQLALGWLMIKDMSSEWFGSARPSGHDYAAADRRITFKVTRAWKGDVGTEVVVSTGYGGGDCGFPFEKGERYLVYADKDEGFLINSNCGRTLPVAAAKGDIQVLTQTVGK